MRQCAMTTVRLPIAVADDPAGAMPSGASVILTPEEANRASEFCHRTFLRKYDTFVPVFRHGSWLWTRLSGQVYLEKADFEWLGEVLGELCEQIAQKEF